jgi:hypothetical protein
LILLKYTENDLRGTKLQIVWQKTNDRETQAKEAKVCTGPLSRGAKAVHLRSVSQLFRSKEEAAVLCFKILTGHPPGSLWGNHGKRRAPDSMLH